MTLNQLAVASAAPAKWLLNSSAILGIPLKLTPEGARWWGLVRVLESTFGLTLVNAGAAATRALGSGNDDSTVVVAGDAGGSATMTVNVLRYDTTWLANLSRARVRETPRRRGRRGGHAQNPIERAIAYGLDIGLIQSALERSPAERLALLDSNRAFVYEMKMRRRKR